MCGGSKPEVDTSYQDWSKEEAAKARADEEARQNRVKLGMDQIRAIFEGGSTRAPTAASGKYDPRQTYYNADGSVWKPTAAAPALAAAPKAAVRKIAVPARPAKTRAGNVQSFFSFDGSPSARPARKATKEENAAAVRRFFGLGDNTSTSPAAPAASKGKKDLTAEDQFARALKGLKTLGSRKTYAGVDPVLAARRKAQESFYLPQLDEQREEAQDQLTLSLARAGLGVSTTANKRRSKLDEGFSRERAGIMADIDRDVAGAAGDYEQQRQSLESQLRASGDATAATEAALRSVATFAKDAPELKPLENALLGLTTGIGSAKNAYDVAQIRQRARGGGTVNRDLSRNVG